MLNNMNTIEKQVFRTYWNDGLLDVFGAVATLVIGITWTADAYVFGAIVPAMLVPLWAPMRQRFIEPRLGLVEFSDQRERRNTNRLGMVAAFGIGTLGLFLMLYFARTRLGYDADISLIAGLPALLLALLAIITAFLVSTLRFLLYAALLAISGIGGAIYGIEPGPILMIAAVAMLGVALFVLGRFLRNNPASGDHE
jgi:hypothetical protein